MLKRYNDNKEDPNYIPTDDRLPPYRYKYPTNYDSLIIAVSIILILTLVGALSYFQYKKFKKKGNFTGISLIKKRDK